MRRELRRSSRPGTASNVQTTSLCMSSKKANGIATACARRRPPRFRHPTPSLANWPGSSDTGGSEHDNGSVEVHGKWMNDKRFISRSFQVRGKEGYQLDGTQIVGWDPSAGVIRSWSFDSEGGWEQAVWSRDGERWLVRVSAVLPDGSVGSEQRLIARVGDAHIDGSAPAAGQRPAAARFGKNNTRSPLDRLIICS